MSDQREPTLNEFLLWINAEYGDHPAITASYKFMVWWIDHHRKDSDRESKEAAE